MQQNERTAPSSSISTHGFIAITRDTCLIHTCPMSTCRVCCQLELSIDRRSPRSGIQPTPLFEWDQEMWFDPNFLCIG